MSTNDINGKDIEEGKECSGESFQTKISADDVRKWDNKIGTYYVVNKVGGFSDRIIHIKVVHTTSNNGKETTEFNNIPSGGKTSGTKFKYTTGANSPFDYWYVEGSVSFGPGMASFKTKDNFYCSVAAKDNGDVNLIIHGDDQGYPTKFEVAFNKSKECTTKFR